MAKRYSEAVIEHLMDPRNRGALEDSNAIAVSGVPGRGPFFLLKCRIVDQVVEEAKFDSHNCGITVACGSVLTVLMKGRTIQDCRSIEAAALIELLGGIPVDKQHVPLLAIATLRQALQEFGG